MKVTKRELEYGDMFLQACHNDKLREQLFALKIRVQDLTGDYVTLETLFGLAKQMGLFDEGNKTEL